MIPNIKEVRAESGRIRKEKEIVAQKNFSIRLEKEIKEISNEIIEERDAGKNGFGYRCPKDLYKIIKNNGYSVSRETILDRNNCIGIYISWQ